MAYCRTGPRAAFGYLALKELGYHAVRVLPTSIQLDPPVIQFIEPSMQILHGLPKE